MFRRALGDRDPRLARGADSVANFLSRTGQYERAHILSSLSLTGLVFAVACATGGIASFAAIWLVVVPLEAALSVSRRAVAIASIFALMAAGLLLALTNFGVLASFDGLNGAALTAFGIISASLYATGLALGAESLARTSSSRCSTRRKNATACLPAT